MQSTFFFTVANLPVEVGILSTLLLVSYLIGGIPFGYFAGNCKGIDIRKEGSGNIGATNVFRVMGKKWGSAVFTLDFLKAFLPVFIVKWALARNLVGPLPLSAELVSILVGIATVVGHNYTPYLGFKGGKGMSSSAGFLLALLPPVFVCCLLTWWILFFATRYVSIGSIMASIMVPTATLYFYPGQYWYLGLALVLCILGIWRHRSNIQRLLNGTENRFVKKGNA